MDRIQDMREMHGSGEPIARIAKKAGASGPAAGKHAKTEGLSPEMPRKREPRRSSPEGFGRPIDGMLEEGRRRWRKRRHAAARIPDRPGDGHGCGGSHPAVRRCVKGRRGEMAAERDAGGLAGSGAGGVVTGGERLAASLPRSDAGLTQVPWGETAGCVRGGPADASGSMGGVPERAAFGSAAGIGRRAGGEIRPSGLFRLLRARHGLPHSFADPYPGSGEGDAGNEVGTHRRNMLVPVPALSGAEALSRRLLERSLGLPDGRPRRKRGTPEPGLSGEGRAALPPLAPQGPSCRRWEARK